MRGLSVAVFGVVLVGCNDQAAPSEAKQAESAPLVASAAPSVTPAATSRSAEAPYNVPERTPDELQTAVEKSCRAAAAKSQPLLLEFSAEWCGDCKALHGLEQREPLAAELKRWEVERVNVGRFDRHAKLLSAFKVKAIANWVVVATDRCDAPLDTWKVKAQRVVEPASGGAVTAGLLAHWLSTARGD